LRDARLRRSPGVGNGSLTELEDIATGDAALALAVNEPRLRVAVEKRPRSTGARKQRGGNAVGIADDRGRPSPKPLHTSVRAIAGVPRDRPVVEFDVEVSRPGIVAIDEHDLEDVELVVVALVVTDAGPRRRESRPPVHRVGPVVQRRCPRVAAGVDVGEVHA